MRPPDPLQTVLIVQKGNHVCPAYHCWTWEINVLCLKNSTLLHQPQAYGSNIVTACCLPGVLNSKYKHGKASVWMCVSLTTKPYTASTSVLVLTHPPWLTSSSSFLHKEPSFYSLLNALRFDPGNKLTAAKSIRGGECGGGQKCWCRAVTSQALMVGWNITHTKAGSRPKVVHSRAWHSVKSLEAHTTLRSIQLLEIRRSTRQRQRGLGYIVWSAESLPKKTKKVTELLSVLHMVSPFPRINYQHSGCYKNTHAIHLPPEDDKTR